MADSAQLGQMFDSERFESPLTRFLIFLYMPIGICLLIIRLFVGFHAFVIACILRKSTSLRCLVLRIMCGILGIVVRQDGARACKVKMLCANHVSALDHLAVDLTHPCILPSVWDIPSILRWCFGYADLGARRGRSELIRQAQSHIANEELPLLAFPEGAITNGRTALLKFSTWPMEVSSSVQPVAISVWRPIDVRTALLGSPWYSDCFWFLFLPFTVIHVHWLPIAVKSEEEPVEDFAIRVSKMLANDLEIKTSSLTNQDAVEAAKRHARARRVPAPAPPQRRVPLDPKRLDEIAMKIKQLHPAVHLFAIRSDLEQTRDQNATIERIKSGKLSSDSAKNNKSQSSADWRRIFEMRKWELIEQNRATYLQRAASDAASDS